MSGSDDVSLKDPHELPPKPTPAQLMAARMATLTAEAISPQAIHLQQMLADMVEAFEHRTGLRTRRRKVGPRANLERAIGALLADVLEAHRNEPQVGLVYRSMNSTALSKGPQTYDGFATAVEALRDRGMIEHFPGYRSDRVFAWGDGVTSTQALGKAARFRATPTLLMLAEGLEIDLEDLDAHYDRPPQTRVLALKAKSKWLGGTKFRGKSLDLPNSPEVAVLSARVRQINDFISGVEIGGGGRHRQFFRGFDLGDQPGFAWNKGGRLYSDGGANYQQMPQAKRLHLTLNGEPVVEIDVKASFLTILHGLTGTPLDMGEDAYAFAGATREVAKGWLTASLGSGKPIPKWPVEMAADFLRDHGETLGKRHKVREVEAAMIHRFPLLGDLARLRLGWAELMYVESEAMIGAMEALMSKGIPALPVHDSLIVPVSAREVASEVLKAMYLEHALIEPRLTHKHL